MAATLSPEAGINDPVVTVERGSAVHAQDGNRVTAGQKLFTVKQDYPVAHIDIVAPEAGEERADPDPQFSALSGGVFFRQLCRMRSEIGREFLRRGRGVW